MWAWRRAHAPPFPPFPAMHGSAGRPRRWRRPPNPPTLNSHGLCRRIVVVGGGEVVTGVHAVRADLCISHAGAQARRGGPPAVVADVVVAWLLDPESDVRSWLPGDMELSAPLVAAMRRRHGDAAVA